MVKTSSAVPKPNSSDSLCDLIIDAIQDIKGKNILRLDLKSLDESPADYFVICEGESHTQVKGISDNIYKRLRDEMGLRPFKTEGEQHANWILVDYFDIVIHIFYKETRGYYDLEDLWSDAKITEYENI